MCQGVGRMEEKYSGFFLFCRLSLVTSHWPNLSGNQRETRVPVRQSSTALPGEWIIPLCSHVVLAIKNTQLNNSKNQPTNKQKKPNQKVLSVFFFLLFFTPPSPHNGKKEFLENQYYGQYFGSVKTSTEWHYLGKYAIKWKTLGSWCCGSHSLLEEMS